MGDATEARREEFERTAVPLMDQVFTVALYLARKREEADDLVQETYLRAFRFWHRFKPGTNCKAWLLTILHNVFRNRYRDRKRESRSIEYDDALLDSASAAVQAGSDSNPEDTVLSRILDSEVEAALMRLPEEFLSAVVLVDVQELTYEEAAEAMGCPIGTVRSRLARGRRLLHKALHEYARERGLLASAE